MDSLGLVRLIIGACGVFMLAVVSVICNMLEDDDDEEDIDDETLQY